MNTTVQNHHHHHRNSTPALGSLQGSGVLWVVSGCVSCLLSATSYKGKITGTARTLGNYMKVDKNYIANVTYLTPSKRGNLFCLVASPKCRKATEAELEEANGGSSKQMCIDI